MIVPKQSQWVLHFLEPTRDLGRLYHNTPLQLPDSVSIEALLSRFAWVIFKSILLVQAGSGKRLLRVRVADAGETAYKNENTDIAAFRALATSRNRSSRPKKRRAVAQPSQDTAAQTCNSLRTSTEYDVKGYTSTLKRKRSSSLDQISARKRDVERLLGGYPSPATSSLEASGSLTYPSSPDSMTQLRLMQIMAAKPDITRSRSFSVSSNNKVLTPAKLELLRRQAIVAQRPTNPTLYCCNYEAVEEDIRADRPGFEKVWWWLSMPSMFGI